MNNKPLALAALLAVAAGAQAQTSVTLYGVADAGLSYVANVEGKTRLVSGIMEGSRFGFRGNEDLGGGYRAIFTLENRLEIDTGALGNRPPSGSRLPARFNTAAALGLPIALQPAVTQVRAGIGAQVGVNHIENNLFDRQAFVGLITPIGAFLGGRQYTPVFEIAATFDTMKNESSLAFGHVIGFPPGVEIRTPNAAAYRIQTGPWTASAMYAFGEASATTGSMWALNALYKTAAFSVGIGYQRRENEVGERSLTNAAIGASVAIGPGTLSALLVDIEDENPRGLTPVRNALTPAIGPVFAAAVAGAFSDALSQDAVGYHVGYRIVSGPHTISASYNRYDDRSGRELDVQSYGAVYSYAFSKRTDVSFVLTRMENDNNAQAAPGQQGFLGGFVFDPGQDTHNIALALRHRF